MTCNNPNVDLVNMNAYIKFGELMTICSQDIKRKRNFGAQIKGHNSGTYVRKMACDNSDVDLVNMNAYIKFGEICQLVLKILSGNEILEKIKDYYSGPNERKRV